jgi:hypothetical protein
MEKLYFVKEGILRVFRIDEQTNIEHTIGFVYPNEAYIPLSALNSWCPASAGLQAIGHNNTIMEIYSND